MSLYQLHRAIYDNMRAGEVSSGKAPAFDISSYDLTDDERKSIESRDIAALYVMGLHPVLLNGFCRASGYTRDDYRAILAPYATTPEAGKGRWQE
jgi:hypothetical protein